MAVIVTDMNGEDRTYDKAATMEAVNGHLYLNDDGGVTIVLFAPGAWRNARVMKGLKD